MEKTILRAKRAVYLININRYIENTIKSCAICQENNSAQQYETLRLHEIPNRPYEVIGTDIFVFNDADWPIHVVRKMPKLCLSSVVVEATKQIFSDMGIPSPGVGGLPRSVGAGGSMYTRLSVFTSMYIWLVHFVTYLASIPGDVKREDWC